MDVLQKICESKVVAIMRGVEPGDVVPIARALHKGGIRAVEVTLNSPRAYELITQLVEEFGSEMTVGAGTVLDPESAKRALDAGAQFIIAPTLNTKTIKMAKRYGAVSIPGCLTPTEILTAYEHGADVIKVFPAGSFGPDYIKDLSGPLGHIPFMATGGITEENIKAYLEAGATCLGLGSFLVPKAISGENDLLALTTKAQSIVRLVQEAQQ